MSSRSIYAAWSHLARCLHACLSLPFPWAAHLSPALLRVGGFFGRVWRSLRALKHHWLGDLIGAVCLFLSFWIVLVVAWGLG